MVCLAFSAVDLAGQCNFCATRNCTWSTAANFRAVIGIFLLQLHDIKISELSDCVRGIALLSSIKLFDSLFLALVPVLHWVHLLVSRNSPFMTQLLATDVSSWWLLQKPHIFQESSWVWELYDVFDCLVLVLQRSLFRCLSCYCCLTEVVSMESTCFLSLGSFIDIGLWIPLQLVILPIHWAGR